MTIHPYQESDCQAWDDYVHNHPDAYHSHMIGWKDVIEQTYKKKSYYLVAEENQKIVGVLPLFHIKSKFFGNQVVSMPYLTYGGVLSDNEEIEKSLIDKITELSKGLGADLELRQVNSLAVSDHEFHINKTKVSMRLELPDSSEALFQSFKAKLRSQVRRPQKEGMTFKLGGQELLSDFYKVFAINMRDIGSPVHSKLLFVNMFKTLGNSIKIGVVYQGEKPTAAGIITLFKKFVEIPWASSLREFNRFSPNMLLYWSFLEYSVNQKYEVFDFGRSTEGESTYKFKKQWRSSPTLLNWYLLGTGLKEENELLKKIFINTWNKIPVGITHKFGPYIRKGISL